MFKWKRRNTNATRYFLTLLYLFARSLRPGTLFVYRLRALSQMRCGLLPTKLQPEKLHPVSLRKVHQLHRKPIPQRLSLWVRTLCCCVRLQTNPLKFTFCLYSGRSLLGAHPLSRVYSCKLWKAKVFILCNISCEAAGEIWNLSLLGVKALNQSREDSTLNKPHTLFHLRRRSSYLLTLITEFWVRSLVVIFICLSLSPQTNVRRPCVLCSSGQPGRTWLSRSTDTAPRSPDGESTPKHGGKFSTQMAATT